MLNKSTTYDLNRDQALNVRIVKNASLNKYYIDLFVGSPSEALLTGGNNYQIFLYDFTHFLTSSYNYPNKLLRMITCRPWTQQVIVPETQSGESILGSLQIEQYPYWFQLPKIVSLAAYQTSYETAGYFYLDYNGGVFNGIIYFVSSFGGGYNAYLVIGYAKGSIRSKIVCLDTSGTPTYTLAHTSSESSGYAFKITANAAVRDVEIRCISFETQTATFRRTWKVIYEDPTPTT